MRLKRVKTRVDSSALPTTKLRGKVEVFSCNSGINNYLFNYAPSKASQYSDPV